jgi:hypothetical protein
MTTVTKPSLAYIATQVGKVLKLSMSITDHIIQVRFALCSTSTFSRTDTSTDSEAFYNSILDLLEDPEEREEVDTLLQWWNRQEAQPILRRRQANLAPRQIFPQTAAESRALIEGSALARIKHKRRAIA